MKTLQMSKTTDPVTEKYKIIGSTQEDESGCVSYKAKCRATGKYVSVRHIRNVFSNSTMVQRVFDEVSIMRQLSQIKENPFTPKLVDIVIPMEQDQDGNASTFSDVVIVTEYQGRNLSNAMKLIKTDSFTLEHALTIVYNLLCSVRFLQSTDVHHQDLKPENILLTDQCNVLIGGGFGSMSTPSMMNKSKPTDSKELQLSDTNSSQDETRASTNRQDDQLTFEEQTLSSFNSDGKSYNLLLSPKPKRRSLEIVSKANTEFKQDRSKRDVQNCIQGLLKTKSPQSLEGSKNYRAPEINFESSENSVNKTEVWSIGRIFFDLLEKTHECQKLKELKSRSEMPAIFDINSKTFAKSFKKCIKTFNEKTDQTDLNKNDDELTEILSISSKYDDLDLTFLEDKKQITSYLHFLDHIRNNHEFLENRSQFQHFKTEILDLLLNMLKFNPNDRPSLDQCIQSPIFDSIRIKKLEQKAQQNTQKIQLDELDFQKNFVDETIIEDFQCAILKEVVKFQRDQGLIKDHFQFLQI